MKARWLRLLWALTRNSTFSRLAGAELMVIAVIDGTQSAFIPIRTNVQFDSNAGIRVDKRRCGTPWLGGDGNDGGNRPVARPPAARADAAAGDVGAAASRDDVDRLGPRARADRLRAGDR